MAEASMVTLSHHTLPLAEAARSLVRYGVPEEFRARFVFSAFLIVVTFRRDRHPTNQKRS
jgi:hypothetical protein